MSKFLKFIFLLTVTLTATLTAQLGFAAQTTSGLYYNTFGHSNNPSVLFLHGGPGYNSYSFEYGAAEALAKAGYYVVVFDQRGAGRSVAGVPSDFTFTKATEDVLDVIHATHLSNPILLGHSWGGTLAIEFLKLQPGIALAAILVNAPVSWPQTLHSMNIHTMEAFHAAKDTKNEQLAKGCLSHMFPNGILAPFNFTLDDISTSFSLAFQAGLYRPSTTTPEAQAIWKQLGARADNKWINISTEAPPTEFFNNERLYEQDFSRDLVPNRALIYAIYGSEDRLFDQVQVDRVASAITKGHLMEIPGAAHFAFIDQRAAFIQAVLSLTAKIPRD
jgi:proline iminopeptidase